MMKLGPEKTGKFQGFGFGAKPAGGAKPGAGGAKPGGGGGIAFSFGGGGGGGGGSKPGAAAGAGAAPAAARRPAGKPAGGVTDLFKAAMDDDGHGATSSSSTSKPVWAKPSHEALQAQRQAEELLAQDPSVFQYDEVLDDIQTERDAASAAAGSAQQVRTDALEQKKRVGLTLRVGSDEVRAGQRRQAKYIEKVMVATDRRKVEQQVIEDRLLKKEKDARKDCEVFVTAAFKEELKKRQKFVEELEAQEARDEAKAAEKQEFGAGFADMYRNLLNGGLASSRGGEKVMEKAPARQELTDDQIKELKEEEEAEQVKQEVKEELAQIDAAAAKRAKGEPGDDDAPGHGVQDVAAADGAPPTEAPAEEPAAKKARLEEEKVERVEKAMSARERFLARKKAAAAGGAEGAE